MAVIFQDRPCTTYFNQTKMKNTYLSVCFPPLAKGVRGIWIVRKNLTLKMEFALTGITLYSLLD